MIPIEDDAPRKGRGLESRTPAGGAHPYFLQSGDGRSEEYYRTIAGFAEEWLAQAMPALGPLAGGFQAWQRTTGHPGRSQVECTFELLALGVLLHARGDQAARLSGREAWALEKLAAAQARLPRAERLVKALRGLVGGLAHLYRSARGPVYASPSDVRRLVRWLSAQGEIAQAGRFSEWVEYLETLRPDRARRLVLQGWRAARSFEAASLVRLGRYTAQVDPYRTRALPRVRWRYDAGLVTGSRVEYHLGMLGTELLNRAYRARFEAATHRMVIVPPCLRTQPEGACQAVQTPLGARCTGCTPACRIHQISRMGEKQGFAVFEIPDDELSKLCISSGQAGSGVGVVGVACALRNWSAGWEADRLGLAAQGLLLDYPGCAKHWRTKEVPTDTSLAQLERLMAQTEAA
jgi:hypothetical protein